MASRMRLLPRSMKLEKSSRTSDLLWRMSARSSCRWLPLLLPMRTPILHDGQDVQVLCAYCRCAGVLGRGFVRSYLPCSSSWINWTAWIEFQKGEVAHDITLALIGSARNGNQDLVLSLSTKAKKMLRNMRTRSLFWAKECRTILRKLMEEKRTLSLMAWMYDEKDVFDVCSWHARNHVVYI